MGACGVEDSCVTVTVKVSVVVFSAVSEAVHVTVVVPIENVEPEAGSQVGPLAAGMMKVAVTSNVTANPDALVEEDEMLDGTVIIGAPDTTSNVPTSTLFVSSVSAILLSGSSVIV